MLPLACGLLRMRGPGRAVWGGSRMRGCFLGYDPVPVLCGPPVAFGCDCSGFVRLRDYHCVFALRVACLAAEGEVFALAGLVEVIGGGGAVVSLRGCASPRHFCVVSFGRRVCRSAIE